MPVPAMRRWRFLTATGSAANLGLSNVAATLTNTRPSGRNRMQPQLDITASEEPAFSVSELGGLVPTDTRKPMDIKKIIARIVDGSRCLARASAPAPAWAHCAASLVPTDRPHAGQLAAVDASHT